MITQIKDLLENIIKTNCPQVTTIVRNAEDEKTQRETRDHLNNPYVSLITNQGDFDDRANAWQKKLNADQKFEQRYKRGQRKLPITLKVYAADEQTADQVLSTILAYIPRSWTHLEEECYITVGVEDHSDVTPEIVGEYISKVSILFEGPAVQPWQEIQTGQQPQTNTNI